MNILILGATSDMAKALVSELANDKHHFFLAGRNINRLEPFSKDLLIRFDAQSTLIDFDAQDCESHEEFYKQLTLKPEWVISFIGYLGDQSIGQTVWEESKKIIEINYTGVASILNIVSQDMESRGSGSIVCVSSVAGDRGRGSNYLYGSTKAGLTAYLSGLRNRLCKKGVHVMTVKPGFVDTQMTADLDLPKPITASPEQVAKAIIKGLKKQKNTVYILPIWRLIMFVIRNIPEFIFKKLKL
ncbi:Short-chain dehydrogenase [Marivirga sericea]|uniref:Short-chain dehydrogenase n=1 Tax=Marivirga sericea TaxID=1028 RepID=A0A1X7KL57_9BACT|nr:SDR family oxidoreductase [Marivirga sericea]SMG41879.1 Short-chain dehydrogenase [Marivirga sericea]